MAGPFDDLIPVSAAPAQGSAPATAPPVQPVIYQDTGGNVTADQAATVRQLAAAGGIDPTGDPGSIRNPRGLRPGGTIPEGQYYLPPGGGVQQAPKGGVALPAAAPIAAQASQGGPAGPSAGVQQGPATPRPGAGIFDDLIPQTNPIVDIAAGTPSNLARGVTAMAGLAHQVTHPKETVRQTMGGLFGQAMPAQSGPEPWDIVLAPLEKLFGRGLAGAAQAGAGVVGGKLTPSQTSSIATLPQGGAPSTQAMDAAIQSFAGPYYQPKTAAGRYVGAVERMIPAAAAGPVADAPILTGLGVVGSGVGSQAGQDLAIASGHPGLAPAASMVGGALGGAPALMMNAPSAVDRVTNAETQNLTPEQIAAIQTARQNAQGVGVPLTVPEAANYVTGNGAPGLLKAQQRIEATPQGASVIGPLIRARPYNMADAINDFANRVSPPSPQPSMVGVNAQTAAKAAIGDLERQRAAATSPYYTAAGPVTVDPDDMAGVMSGLDARISADKTGVISKPLTDVRDMLTDQAATQAAAKAAKGAGPAPQSVRDSVEQAWAQVTGEPAPGVQAAAAGPSANPSRIPVLDIENLDRARKYLRDQAETRLGNGSFTPEQAAAMNGVANQLDTIMERASPSFVAGKQTHADLSQNLVGPAQAGPLGSIARTDNVPTQTSALLPERGALHSPSETASALSAMGQQNPLVGPQLVRDFVDRAAGARFGGVGGPDPYAGTAWLGDVAGSQGQRANLDAALGAIDGSGALQGQFNDLADALAAAGGRLPVSPAESAAVDRALSPSPTHPLELGVAAGVGREAFGHGGSIALPIAAKAYGAVRGALDKARISGNAQRMAQGMVAPADRTAANITAAQRAVANQSAKRAQLLTEALLAHSNASAQAAQ